MFFILVIILVFNFIFKKQIIFKHKAKLPFFIIKGLFIQYYHISTKMMSMTLYLNLSIFCKSNESN